MREPLHLIRVIPKYGGPDMFYDLTDMTPGQRKTFTEEVEHGGYIQYQMMADPMPVLVAARIRKEMETEQAATRDHYKE